MHYKKHLKFPLVGVFWATSGDTLVCRCWIKIRDEWKWQGLERDGNTRRQSTLECVCFKVLVHVGLSAGSLAFIRCAMAAPFPSARTFIRWLGDQRTLIAVCLHFEYKQVSTSLSSSSNEYYFNICLFTHFHLKK